MSAYYKDKQVRLLFEMLSAKCLVVVDSVVRCDRTEHTPDIVSSCYKFTFHCVRPLSHTILYLEQCVLAQVW